jgi:hypothetical protein
MSWRHKVSALDYDSLWTHQIGSANESPADVGIISLIQS